MSTLGTALVGGRGRRMLGAATVAALVIVIVEPARAVPIRSNRGMSRAIQFVSGYPVLKKIIEKRQPLTLQGLSNDLKMPYKTLVLRLRELERLGLITADKKHERRRVLKVTKSGTKLAESFEAYDVGRKKLGGDDRDFNTAGLHVTAIQILSMLPPTKDKQSGIGTRALSEKTGVPRATIATVMQVLESLGVVETRKISYENVYALRSTGKPLQKAGTKFKKKFQDVVGDW